MATARTFDFPTGTTYEGAWDERRECMHGFGCYKYPDGSIYHGYFTNGKFHGFGSLRLAAPYAFTIKGFFENGQLKKIETMFFDDGLHVDAHPKGKTLDFSEWRYCSKEDRRFPMEILNGLRAVGPNSMTTQNYLERKLAQGEFDTEQGVYHPNSGFITNRPPPYTPSQFLGCADEINWIERNCREGYDLKEQREPEKDVCKDIIKTNIEGQHLTDMKFGSKCALGQKPGHKYFAKLYAIEIEESRKNMKCMKNTKNGLDVGMMGAKEVLSGGSIIAEKSESCSSFSVNFKDSALDNLVCERKGDFLDRSDKSLSLNISFLNTKQTMFN